MVFPEEKDEEEEKDDESLASNLCKNLDRSEISSMVRR